MGSVVHSLIKEGPTDSLLLHTNIYNTHVEKASNNVKPSVAADTRADAWRKKAEDESDVFSRVLFLLIPVTHKTKMIS